MISTLWMCAIGLVSLAASGVNGAANLTFLNGQYQTNGCFEYVQRAPVFEIRKVTIATDRLVWDLKTFLGGCESILVQETTITIAFNSIDWRHDSNGGCTGEFIADVTSVLLKPLAAAARDGLREDCPDKIFTTDPEDPPVELLPNPNCKLIFANVTRCPVRYSSIRINPSGSIVLADFVVPFKPYLGCDTCKFADNFAESPAYFPLAGTAAPSCARLVNDTEFDYQPPAGCLTTADPGATTAACDVPGPGSSFYLGSSLLDFPGCDIDTFAANVVREPGRCVMLEDCDARPDASTGEFTTLCANNAKAQRQYFKMPECPFLENEKRCCTAPQYEALVVGFRQAEPVLGRCPACFNNFKYYWCMYQCGPDQSMYVEPTRLARSAWNLPVVAETKYHVAEDVLNTLYDSCKDVKLSGTGQNVMRKVFASSSWQDFTGFMGDPLKHAPYRITASASASGMRLNNSGQFVPCSTNNSKLACGCVDCVDQCKGLREDEPPAEPASIFEANGDPALASLFGAIGATFGVVLFFFAFGRRRKPRKPETAAAPGADADQPAAAAPPAAATADATTTHAAASDDGDDDEEPRTLGFAERLAEVFRQVAEACARNPYRVFLGVFVLVALAAVGLTQINNVTDPVELWVPQDSTMLSEKRRSEKLFGEFWRIEQLFVKADPARHTTVFTYEILSSYFAFENVLRNMRVPKAAAAAAGGGGSGATTSLDDLCFKPLPGKGCLVNSIQTFWEKHPKRRLTADDPVRMQNVAVDCTLDSTSAACRGHVGVPMDAFVVLGGYEEETDPKKAQSFLNATTIVTTFLLLSDKEIRSDVEAWEELFLASLLYVSQATEELPLWAQAQLGANATASLAETRAKFALLGLSVSFSTEGSLESQLNRDSGGDALVLGLSYIFMIFYVAFALGHYKDPVSRKLSSFRPNFFLGFFVILMIALAGFIAFGLGALLQIRSSFVVMPVIPFLIVAIGLNDVFLIVGALEQTPETLPIDLRLGAAMHSVGKTVLTSTTCHIFAFLLGVLTRMPAVQMFAAYIVLGVFWVFILQVTLFMAIVSVFHPGSPAASSGESKPKLAGDSDASPDPVQLDDLAAAQTPPDTAGSAPADSNSAPKGSPAAVASDSSLLVTPSLHGVTRFIDATYAPFLLRRSVQAVVLVVFFGFALVSLASWPQSLQLGLDQEIALPKDSYLQGYFDSIFSELRTGAPLFLVVEGTDREGNVLDWSDPAAQDKICGNIGCGENSVQSVVAQRALAPASSFVARAATSWFDDYTLFLSSPGCCRRNTTDGSFCSPGTPDPKKVCDQCLSDAEKTLLPPGKQTWRPFGAVFDKYWDWFLESECSEDCASCGASHLMNLHFDDETGKLAAFRFMSFNTVLKRQRDFIHALKAAKSMESDIRSENDVEMFAISSWHVFFEQYLWIESVAALNIGLALLVIGVVFLGSVRSPRVAAVVMGSTLMVILEVLAVMGWWSIPFNAISVVNLVMAVGLSVEFGIHIALAFSEASGPPAKRAHDALVRVGYAVYRASESSVLGVLILVFAPSRLFEVLFFRMYFSVVVLGALHGLVFVPVLLVVTSPTGSRHLQATTTVQKPEGKVEADRSES